MHRGIYRKYIKRPMDFILSLLAIIVLSPVLLITALLFRIKLGSPVIFKQKRPGLNERIFTLYKFRTMTDERNDNGEFEPNYWLSCMIIDRDAMCPQARDDHKAVYHPEHGNPCPMEILEKLASYNTEGRPIWKPMHMQPVYRDSAFVNRYGFARGLSDAYIDGGMIGNEGLPADVGADIFERGLHLPSDNKMTKAEQDRIIEIVRACFE